MDDLRRAVVRRPSCGPEAYVIDSIAWVHDHLLERLEVPRRLRRVAVHPTCACSHRLENGRASFVIGASDSAGCAGENDVSNGFPARQSDE